MGRKAISHIVVGCAACVSVLLSIPIMTASSGPTPARETNYLELGVMAVSAKRFEDADSRLSKAIKGDLNQIDLAIAYHHRGIARQKLGENEDAIDDYTKAIASGMLPDAVAAQSHYNRGILLAAGGSTRRAELDYSRTIELDPSYAAAYHNRANLERERGDYPTAIRDYSEAIQRLSGDSLKLPLLGRAVAQEKAGDVRAALHDVEAALAIDSLYGPALKRRGKLAPMVAALDKKAPPTSLALAGQNLAVQTDDTPTGALKPVVRSGEESKKALMKVTKAPITADKKTIKIASVTPDGAFRVQLGAFKASDLATKAWTELLRREGKLADLDHYVEQADLGQKGIYYRLQAGSFETRAEARTHCASLAQSRIDCIVVATR